RGRVDAANGGKGEQTRENRHVRRRASQRRAEAEDARPIEAGDIRRRELLGDEDRVGRIIASVIATNEQGEDTASHVAHVLSACREELVFESGQERGMGFGGRTPRVGGGS